MSVTKTITIALLLLIFVFLCTGLMTAQQSDAPEDQTNPFAGNPAAVTAGARLYTQACIACHGGNGAGDRGPALNTRTLARGSRDGEIFLNIRAGIAGTQMPPFSGLSTDQTWQLVSYIRSLSAAPATARNSEPSTGDASEGEKLFYGKAGCANCHAVNSRGGVVGPDLSGAGSSAVAVLQQRILNPNGSATPGPAQGGRGGRGARGAFRGTGKTYIVKTADGKEIRGVGRAEDAFTLDMVDASGQLRMFDKRKIAGLRVESVSLMPDDYGKRLSTAEVGHIVAYLKLQNGRDMAQTIRADIPGGLSYERQKNSKAEPQNWFMYWGDYQGTHFSPLKDINTTNVKQLQAKWALQMPGQGNVESTPIVVDGVMYTAGQPGTVFAVDAASGRQLWRFDRAVKKKNPYANNQHNRGVAMLDNRIFVGTLDAALVALDARNGLPLWEVQVADTMEGYSITSAPLVIKDKVLVGISGGEYPNRGFMDAYDAKTGKRLWRFYSVPGPGEPGNETWEGDSWKRGGSDMWLTGSYDPELDTIYWTTGNPAPSMNSAVRKGDNLYSCSVVALDPNTGTRKWHFQFTPADSHDWDSTEDVILIDREYQGQQRKLLLQANRNGILYLLDRTNGKFLAGNAFVRQTWMDGFDANGRPNVKPETVSSPTGSSPVFPNLGGGTNFQSPSYDRANHRLYLEYSDVGQRFFSIDQTPEIGKLYTAGRGQPVPDDPNANSGIRALDPDTGKVIWEFRLANGSLSNGVLGTAGGLVFAMTGEGNLIALDSTTGAALWKFFAGGSAAAAPMSYAVDGKQYVAVSAGQVLYSFGLPE